VPCGLPNRKKATTGAPSQSIVRKRNGPVLRYIRVKASPAAYARRSGDAPAVWDGTSEMWAALYVFTVCFVALTLFAAVNELENRPLAAALKFFIIAVAVAAIASARRLLP
jgi:hypothetical protein